MRAYRGPIPLSSTCLFQDLCATLFLGTGAQVFDFISKLLNKNQTTDIEITWRGHKAFNNFIEQQITSRDIFNIQQEQGYDVAAFVLYKALKEKEEYQNFAKFIEEKRPVYSPTNKETVVFIMTHNPWMPYGVNTDYQWRLKNVVADAGYEYCIPEIQYRRSIFANAYYYQDILKRYKGRKVLFLTHSLASLEMRWFFEKTKELNIEIQGWLNMSGLIYGTSLPPSSNDWFLSVKRYLSDAHPVTAEVSRSNSYWYGDFAPPGNIPMVSLVGFTPSKLSSYRDSMKGRDLKFWGPHDGFVTLSDYLNVPGVVWPLWKEGHYIQVESFKNRLQSTLNYLCTQSENRRLSETT